MNGYDDMPPLVDSFGGPGGFIPPPPASSMHDQYGGGYNGGAPGWGGGGYGGGAGGSPYVGAGWNGAGHQAAYPGPRRTPTGVYDYSAASSPASQGPWPPQGSPWGAHTPQTWPSSTPQWAQPETLGYPPHDMSLIPGNSSGMNHYESPVSYNGAGYNGAPPSRQSPYPNRPTSTGPWEQQGAMVRSSSPYHHARASSLSIPNSYHQDLGRSYSHGHRKKTYSSMELGNRPGDWRKDFTFRSGLAALLPRARRRGNSFSGYTDGSHYTLSPNIQYNSSRPPLFLDLRNGPGAVEFFTLTKPFSMVDMMQLITTPPIPSMRLYHSHLPWYIDIVAQNPTGITMHDFFDQLCGHLMRQISAKHYYTEEMNEDDRRKVAKAFKQRCEGHEIEISSGIRRIDYLRGRVLFEGLSKGKDGMWEMKTRKE